MAPKKDTKKAEEKPTKTEEKKEKVEKTEKADAEPRPTKPDEAEYAKKLDAVKAEIDNLKKAQESLIEKINAKNTGKDEYEAKRSALYEELAVMKQEKGEKMAALKLLKDAEADRKREEKEAKSKMSSLEKSLSSEEEIDREIQQIELKMSTTTMSLKQEKDLMNQIKKLKATRPEVQKKVREYEAMKAKCESSVQASGLSVKDQIEQLQKEYSEKAAKHSEIYTKIDALKKSRAAEMGDVSDLITKKQELKAKIMGLQEQRNNIWNEKKEQMRIFNEWDKKQRLARKKELEAKWQAEQAERAAQNAAAELEKPNPFLDETTLLEQTIDYCNVLLGLDKKAAEVEKVDPTEWKAPVEGAQVMKAKKDRDTEFYFAPTKGKKAPKAPKAAEKKDTKIKHTAATFEIFSKLKVAAPISTDDVPPLLEKLKKSLDEYNVKVKAWESERLAKIEEAKNNPTTAVAVA